MSEDVHWGEVAPERGGVIRQYTAHTSEDVWLTLETREGESWLWIDDSEGDRRVLSFDETDPNAVLAILSQIEDPPSIGNYLEFMGLGATLVAHEQFTRTFLNELPRPADAVYYYFSDVLQAIGEGSDEPEFHATLGEPSPPSATTGLRLALAAMGFEGGPKGPSPKVTYDETIPQYPHPHQPKARVDFTLHRKTAAGWVAEGPAPSEQVIRSIGRIAHSGYDVDTWGRWGAEIGPSFAGQWGQLLAVMAHGVPVPNRDVFDWVQRTQIAAALCLAHLDAGWGGSQRKRALIHLALGPIDWGVTAAIVALNHLVRFGEAPRDEVEELYAFLMKHAPRTGYACYGMPLALMWLDLGCELVDEEEVREWGYTYWQGGDADQEAYDGLDLTGYAELLRDGGTHDTWAQRVSGDAGLSEELEDELHRADVRKRLLGVDPATDGGRALIREGIGL